MYEKLLPLLLIVCKAENKTSVSTVFEYKAEKICSACSLEFGGSINYKNATDEQTIFDIGESYGCNLSDYAAVPEGISYVVVKRGNCTFSERGKLLREKTFKGIILKSDTVFAPSTSDDEDVKSNLLICTVSETFYKKLSIPVSKSDRIIYYQATDADYNLPPFQIETILIFTIAVVSILLSAKYVQALERFKLKEAKRERSDSETNNENAVIENEQSEEITGWKLVSMVIWASGFLLLLFFFYKYLVWVIMAIFCFFTAIAFVLLSYNVAILNEWTCVRSEHKIKIPCLGDCTIFETATLFIGLSLSITWFIFRHSDWSWVLQNIMGFIFCTTVPSQIKVKNLKMMALMLLAFFVYDVFMVFGTPLLTKDNKSVMVEVATGAGTGEQLPILFKVPKFFTSNFIKSCGREYSMLGFGDVIIPGVMTALCVRFDMVMKHRRVRYSYLLWGIVSYGLGLMACFVALYFMEMGQPALLYINPSMVGIISLVALIRGEFSIFWNKGLEGSIDQKGIIRGCEYHFIFYCLRFP